MGYSTDFSGRFQVSPPLTPEQVKYLKAFNETRRMIRAPDKAATLPDDLRKAVGLPVGPEGAYYVGSHTDGFFGQSRDSSILDYNISGVQPSLWCQWTPTDDGTAIKWDGAEKFYSYTEWIRFIIEHFLEQWGCVLNGTVEWAGEDHNDRGRIVIKDNMVKAQPGRVVYEDS